MEKKGDHLGGERCGEPSLLEYGIFLHLFLFY
jgi:hypothetical protein